MAGDSRGLGRGLGALLGAAPTVSASRGGGTLPLALMRPGAFQPRQAIHSQPLEELAASIKANGVIQPIVVRKLPEAEPSGARYEIIAGERRWQAAKLAGLADIPAIVRELSDREASAVALIENIQREELTAAEEARALKRLVEDYGLTQQEVGDFVGRSRAAVTNLIRLLELPASLIALIDSKALSMGHARALLGVGDDVARERLAQMVVGQGLSVRETEKRVQAQLAGYAVPARKEPQLAVISEIARTRTLHAQLHQKGNGAARIIIDVADEASRDAIVEAIQLLGR